MSLRLFALLILDCLMWALERLAKAIVDSVPAELWHALEDEAPLMPVLWRNQKDREGENHVRLPNEHP